MVHAKHYHRKAQPYFLSTLPHSATDVKCLVNSFSNRDMDRLTRAPSEGGGA